MTAAFNNNSQRNYGQNKNNSSAGNYIWIHTHNANAGRTIVFRCFS